MLLESYLCSVKPFGVQFMHGSLHDQSKCSMIVFHSVSLYFLETDLSIIEPLTLFTEKKESGSFQILKFHHNAFANLISSKS